MGKVRIYELAKELKLENRKVLEDARRLGVDVSVPSNTLDDNIAEKIRETYYPKKDAPNVHRTARLVKTVKQTAPLSTAEGSAAAPAQEPDVVEAATVPQVEATPSTQTTEQTRARVVKLVPQPPAPAPIPAAVPDTAPLPPIEPEVEEAEEIEIEPAAAAAEAPAFEGETAAVEPAPATTATETTITPSATPAPSSRPLSPAQPQRVPDRTAGTSVIRLTPRPPRPVSPAATPATRTPATTGSRSTTSTSTRTSTPGTRSTGNLEQRIARGVGRTEASTTGQPHLLPSGAEQRVVYIPPKDTRHKGRHSTRPRGGQPDRQEGHQLKISTRRGPTPIVPPKVRVIPTELKPIRVVEGTTVRELADKLEVKPKDVVSLLFERGIMATINQTLTPERAQEIGQVFGFEVSVGAFEDMTIESEFEVTPEAMEDTDTRAPVVTVMGHVDHGKTSLLDAIREARVAEGEAGGITQHIGAYAVDVPNPDDLTKRRRIVFLDTPGHEAFTLMRARGAKVTDVVVLVVAADDGVMPQTVEAIDHARAANVPIVVAINKVDKPDANAERVKKELADRGLLWDSWGGTTTMVEVSAKKKQNIDSLLEMILLTSDILDLKANPKRLATGTVLEAKLDRGRGAVATLLIQNGSLHIHDPFIVGNFFGRVRALIDDRGRQVQEVGPSTPVEVLGLQGVPSAGDQFQAVTDITKAQKIAEYRQSKARIQALSRTAARGLDQLHAQLEAGEVKELLVILKADVQGSVEVLKDTLVKLSTDRVKVRIILSGVGAITESDVLLASASNVTTTGAATVIIGFNVRPESRADEVGRQEDVDIRLHSIIYKVEEEIRAAMIGMLDATIKETVIGKAEIRDVIRVPKIGSIAGCMVTSGSIKRTARGRLIRDSVVINDNPIGSLRRFKDDVSEVAQGFECGITIERFNDYKVGDVIEAYITEKVAATQL